SLVTASGHGLAPGSETSLFVHSTPVLLGQSTVAADGTVSLTALIPAGLAAGDHHLAVEATAADGSPASNEWAFSPAADGTYAPIDQGETTPSAPAASPSSSSAAAPRYSTSSPATTASAASSRRDTVLPVWRAAEHPRAVVGTQAGAFAILAVV